jgi:hypothetical protein
MLETGTRSCLLRVLEIRIHRRVENGHDPAVDTAAMSVRVSLDRTRKLVVETNRQLGHAFMLAGMNA